MSQRPEWALVVGAGVNALGVVRSLGQAGVPVAVLSLSGQGPALASRFVRQKKVGVELTELVEQLRAMAIRLGGRPVLFLTEEEVVRRVSAARALLAPHLRFRFAPHEQILALTHKEGVQRLAEQAGLRIPRALRLQAPEDAKRLDELRYPCVLKPGLKHAAYGARFKKAYRVESAAEARTRFAEIAPVLADLVVQEWIEGEDDALFFCLQYRGEQAPVASFTGRKLRAWPPQVGGTASCIAAPEAAAELSALTDTFFSAVGLQGWGSMEYKRDRRDGLFYVVEPTVGRTDFQEEIATLNGVNLPLAAYCHECGLPAPALAAGSARIWREPTTHRWSTEMQGPHPAFRNTPVVDAFFRWGDPGPWWQLQWGRLGDRLRTLLPNRLRRQRP